MCYLKTQYILDKKKHDNDRMRYLYDKFMNNDDEQFMLNVRQNNTNFIIVLSKTDASSIHVR